MLWVHIRSAKALLMSTHKICIHGKINNTCIFFWIPSSSKLSLTFIQRNMFLSKQKRGRFVPRYAKVWSWICQQPLFYFLLSFSPNIILPIKASFVPQLL